MNKENLKGVFTKPYNREDWQNLIRNVFPGTTFFAEPHPIPVPKEEIEEFFHTGNIRLNDGKSLAIFELRVSDKIKLKRNRVSLHTVISKYIDQASHHGVLALFDSNSKDYRFTFTAKDSQITETGFETKVTDAKRYTYVFGPNETCRTAIERFEILANNRDSITIDDVEEAFSVEKLNKEFFKQYKEQYEKFVCFITGKHFVKKRSKWVEEVVHEPHEYLSYNFENDDKQARDFIKKSLGRLVFLYFLQKKGWMGCPPERADWTDGDQKFMQHYFDNCQNKDHFHSKFLVPLYFECLNLKRDNDVFELTNSRIPYLNGGLFEENKLNTNEIDFPTTYWENLFNFFDQYNFTIDENDPFEQEVGIDPEMLGHIFENLLEDNKDKGAFYTPKPIVEYMCKESLIQYLKTRIFSSSFDSAQNDKNKDEVEALENFIRNHDPGDPEEKNNYVRNNAEHIEKLLDDVKICDPAIGSGAFPMGLLQEIFWAKMTLDWTLNPADTKKKIIENSIYGVDIDSGAIDIARLRFWLSLIVDTEKPEPLPNLDYKIMQGNSLLESFEGIDLSNVLQVDYKPKTIVEEPEQADLFDDEPKQQALVLEDHDVNSIVELKHKLFQSSDPKEKEECKKQIDKIVMDNIEFNLNIKRDKLNIEIDRMKNKLRDSLKMLHSFSQTKEFLKKNRNVKKLRKKKKELNSLNPKYKKLAELQHTTDRPFFLWHLYFSEVFDEKGGFDIVIGNPPYIRVDDIDKYLKNTFKNSFKTSKGKYDIYYLFFEKGHDLLTENGTMVYITPNKFCAATSAFNLRDIIVSKNHVIEIVSTSMLKVFKDASNYPLITILSKRLNNQFIKVRQAYSINKINRSTEMCYNLEYKDFLALPNKVIPINISEKYITITLKLLKSHKLLGSIFSISEGLRIPGKFENAINGIPIVKQFQFNKWSQIKYDKWITDDKFSKIISTKTDRYCKIFQNKILIAEDALEINATYDDKQFIPQGGVYFGICTNEYVSLNVVLSLLNSELLSFVYSVLFGGMHMGGGYLRYRKMFIELLPLPSLVDLNQNSLINLSNQILQSNQFGEDTQMLENQIDLIVYKLYELTYEEAKIVDPELDKVLAEFGLSKEDYERMSVEELGKLLRD